MSNPTREEVLFHEALDRPAAGRDAFLQEACAGDAALRARVEALLTAYDRAPTYLNRAPVIAPPAARPDEKVGDRIDRYKLLQKIGEGGCGTVYMAEQEEPVRRRVALKVIKLGMDTKEVIARFEAERQALAMMDHPNIAKILDAGATETGRPYFVMELVRGMPITKFCDEQNLPTAARVELFTQVCHAIQHAHQKGIIHRDIKPSNILVALHDTVAVPKVIDFGIAKATQGRLTDHTLFTALEQFIGTPAYMSPEQAQLSGIDIDTRSDVYSLGVLLYELLTGRTPFDAKELLRAGLDEIRRQIREVEPVKPSTCLGTLEGEALTTTARLRQTAAPKLISFISGDLDWIVMRCLEKDRTRRYDTANALAVDLQHFVRDEPVTARPPSPWYVLRKVGRRHRVAVIGAGAFLLVVVGGTAISAWQIASAERASNETWGRTVRSRNIQSAARFAVDLLLVKPTGDGKVTDTLTVRATLDNSVRRVPVALSGIMDTGSAELEASWRGTLALGYLALGDHAAALPQAERAFKGASQLARENKPTATAAHQRPHNESLERLVQIYRRWDAAEPNTGKAALAATWQQKLDEHTRAHPASAANSNRKPSP